MRPQPLQPEPETTVEIIPLAVLQDGEAKWVNTHAFKWLTNEEFTALKNGVLASWLAL